MWIIAKRRFLFINPKTDEQYACIANDQPEEAPDWIKEDDLFKLAKKEKSLIVTEAPEAEEEDEKKDDRVKHTKPATSAGLPAGWKK